MRFGEEGAKISATNKRSIQQLLQPDSAMSRFLLVVATLLGKNRAKTPRRLSKCWADAPKAHQTTDYSKRTNCKNTELMVQFA